MEPYSEYRTPGCDTLPDSSSYSLEEFDGITSWVPGLPVYFLIKPSIEKLLKDGTKLMIVGPTDDPLNLGIDSSQDETTSVVYFTPPTAGQYTISMTIDDDPILNSPLTLNVNEKFDIDKVKGENPRIFSLAKAIEACSSETRIPRPKVTQDFVPDGTKSFSTPRVVLGMVCPACNKSDHTTCTSHRYSEARTYSCAGCNVSWRFLQTCAGVKLIYPAVPNPLPLFCMCPLCVRCWKNQYIEEKFLDE